MKPEESIAKSGVLNSSPQVLHLEIAWVVENSVLSIPNFNEVIFLSIFNPLRGAFEISEIVIFNKPFCSQVQQKDTKKWAEPDSNRRSSPREGDVLTELDYRPNYISEFQILIIPS